MNTIAIKAKRIFLKAAAFLSLLFCVFFSACDKGATDVQPQKYELYIQTLEYDEDNLTLFVVVSVEPSERVLPCTADYYRTVKKDGAFWNIYSTHYVFDCDALYACVTNAISDGERNYNSMYYSDLKIVFDYATIYKSTSSGGELVVEGRNYHHRFLIQNNGEQTVILSRRSPYTAAWWGVLICVGLAVTFAVAAVSAAVGGKNGRQRQD